jgi:hypothetical protein
VNKILQYCISFIHTKQDFYKKHCKTWCLIALFVRAIAKFGKWGLLKTIAKQWKVSYKFCRKWCFQIYFHYEHQNPSSLDPVYFTIYFRSSCSNYFIYQINELNTNSDLDVNLCSDTNNLYPSIKRTLNAMSSQYSFDQIKNFSYQRVAVYLHNLMHM